MPHAVAANTVDPTPSAEEQAHHHRFCCLSTEQLEQRDFTHIADPDRRELVASRANKWPSGTVIKYYFYTDAARRETGGLDAEAQLNVVRAATKEWEATGMGIRFEEVFTPHDAVVRIAFQFAKGSSASYVGTVCQRISVNSGPTTWYGWDLTTRYGKDTALHELGHVLGFQHEHQNPKAGIVWHEQRVLESFRAPPNNWSDQQIRHNILRKIPQNTVENTHWDMNSIMHYGFEAGLIKEPTGFENRALIPAPGLSPLDIDMAKTVYPRVHAGIPELAPLQSVLFHITPGSTVQFSIAPDTTRDYTIETLDDTPTRTGSGLDTELWLYETRPVTGTTSDEVYITHDDDSGMDRNAKITRQLAAGSTYLVRIKLYPSVRVGGKAAILLR